MTVWTGEDRPPGVRIVAVIPAYNASERLAAVARELPKLFSSAIVVDDGSTDDTHAVARRCAEADARLTILRHEHNRGVGAAMVTGFRAALEEGADIVVKIDGDGQMPLDLVPALVRPLLSGEADYTKGNRFRDFKALRQMPVIRRVGNLALSFLAKAATGYWQCFDPTNGFVAIRGDVLAQLPLEKIDRGYYFETSTLGHLYLLGAVVRDIPMPARYGGEPSHLSVARVLQQFPARLLYSMLRRLVLKNYLFDFNVGSLHLLFGTILFGAGVVFGGYNWVWYARHRLPAPTGTVALAAVLVILGFQLLLSAVNLDLDAAPHEPINGGPLVVFERRAVRNTAARVPTE